MLHGELEGAVAKQPTVIEVRAIDRNRVERLQPKQTTNSATTHRRLVVGIKCFERSHVPVSEAAAIVLHDEAHDRTKCHTPRAGWLEIQLLLTAPLNSYHDSTLLALVAKVVVYRLDAVNDGL
jgi:hypothetical protein